MNLSIIIPAKNEEKRIPKTLDAIGSLLSQSTQKEPIEAEVIVIVNNSTDNTLEVVKTFSKKYPFIKYVNIPHPTGKGGAVVTGLKLAKGDVIGFMDADGSSSPKEMLRLYNDFITMDEDGIIASRYVEGAKIAGTLPLSRKIYSRLFNIMVRVLFGLNYKDTQCGLKLFKKDAAKNLAPKIASVGWTFDLNLLLISKYLNYTIREVPSVWKYEEGSVLNTKKALLSVPREIIVLKKLEFQLKWQNFIKRTFKDSKPNPSTSILWVSNRGRLPGSQLTLIRKLAKNYDLTVFSPKITNKAGNEQRGSIEYVRRGSPGLFPVIFLAYYLIFFRGRYKFVILDANSRKQPPVAYRMLPKLIPPSELILLDRDSLEQQGFTFKLNIKNIKNLVSASRSPNLLTDRYYPWSNTKLQKQQ